MPVQYTVWRSASEVPQGPVLNENVIAVGGTSAQSPSTMDSGAAKANEPRRVRITATENVYVTWGLDPTAVNDGTEGRIMGTDTSTVEYFDIPAGYKLAVISRS